MSTARTLRGAGPGRGDGDQSGAGGEVEHPAAGDQLGVVQHIPGQRLTAGPGERPERRRLLAVVLPLAQLPQPDRIVGLVQHHLGHERDRLRVDVGRDEGGGVARHRSIVPTAPVSSPGGRPRTVKVPHLVHDPTSVSTVTAVPVGRSWRRAVGRMRAGWARPPVRWSGVVLGLAEALIAIGLAIGFMLWSLTIDVDPMSRRGQVSGLAQLQFRLALCVLALVVGLVVAQRLLRGRHRGVLVAVGCAAVAGLATGLVGGGIAVALRGTPYGLWAGDGDYAWILYWVNRMSAHQPVPDYYPPLYLDLLRVWSHWSGQPPVYAVKPVQLVGTALFGPAAYLSWRLVLRPGWALGIGLVAAFPFIEPVKPYTQVTLVMLVPVLIALLRRVRRADGATPVGAVWTGVRYGAGLAVLFLLYSGWFVWGAPGVLVAFALLAPWRRATGRALLLAGSAVAVFLALCWPFVRGLADPTGGRVRSVLLLRHGHRPGVLRHVAQRQTGRHRGVAVAAAGRVGRGRPVHDRARGGARRRAVAGLAAHAGRGGRAVRGERVVPAHVPRRSGVRHRYRAPVSAHDHGPALLHADSGGIRGQVRRRSRLGPGPPRRD